MKTITFLCLFIGVACGYTLDAQVIRVPEDHASIQAGIDAASDGDTVLVSQGTYYEQINFKGKAITVASEYLMDGDTNHVNTTILDGYPLRGLDTASVVSFVSGEDTTSVLCGFTVQGGGGTATVYVDGTPTIMGGGVYCYESGAKIIHNKIINNHVKADSMAGGGGIGTNSEFGDHWLVVENNLIAYNTCKTTKTSEIWTSAFGAGIFGGNHSRVNNNIIQYNECYSTYAADGAGVEFSTTSLDYPVVVYLTNNDIQYNNAFGDILAFGAGVSDYFTVSTVKDNVINHNSCIAEQVMYAAGISVFGFNGYGGEVLIQDNDISFNTCEGEGISLGTAICVQNPDYIVTVTGNQIEYNGASSDYNSNGTVSFWNYFGKNTEVVLEGNLIRNNFAGWGGAVSVHDTYNFRFINNLFLNNEANFGAAIYMQDLSPASARSSATNDEFFNENDKNVFFRKQLSMAGLANHKGLSEKNNRNNDELAGQSHIVNNTFVHNTATLDGGAIYNEFDPQLLVTFNNIFWLNDALFGQDIFNSSSQPIVVAYSDIDAAEIVGPWDGISNINSDPGLLNDSLHLDQGSPCIDIGAMEFETDEMTYLAPDTDIDGEERPLGGHMDIGADEYIVVGLEDEAIATLEQKIKVFPNPVHSEANIQLSLKENADCELTIFSSDGKPVQILFRGILPAGDHSFTMDSKKLSGGLYLIHLRENNRNHFQQLVVLK